MPTGSSGFADVFGTGLVGALIGMLALVAWPARAGADESLGFTAEHMIEAQMDARYLALPEIPMRAEDGRARVDLGYLSASGGLIESTAALLAVQRFSRQSGDRSWRLGVGGFLDLIRFGGSEGDVAMEPIFTGPLPVAVPFKVNVLDISGDAVHAGLSIAIARYLAESWAWQAGLALEYYDVGALRIAFQPSSESGFDGEVDYAGNYSSVTPYLTVRHRALNRTGRLIYTSRFVVAWPQPRRGFHGRISGPGFVIENESDAVGNGRHIPDGFAGFGFAIESAEHGWSVDLGASLWLLLAESKVHQGVDPPLFIRFSRPIH